MFDLAYVAGVGLRDAEVLDQFQYGIRIDRFHSNRVAKYIIDSDLGVLSSAVSGAELMSRFADAHDSYSVNPAMIPAAEFLQLVRGLGQGSRRQFQAGEDLGVFNGFSNGNPALRTGFHCSESPILAHGALWYPSVWRESLHCTSQWPGRSGTSLGFPSFSAQPRRPSFP